MRGGGGRVALTWELEQTFSLFFCLRETKRILRRHCVVVCIVHDTALMMCCTDRF
jgi:hypothetical protein